ARRPRPAAPSRGRRLGARGQTAAEHAAHRRRGRAYKEDARMTLAYFDCFSGISGDMTLGALIDCGADRAVLDAAVEALRLGDEVKIDIRHESRGHAGGTRILVGVAERVERTVPARRRVLEDAGAPGAVQR